MRLAEDSDVFLTNFRRSARRRLGIDVNDLMARNPKIVYARASATGPRGPEAENAGFDGVTYWARSGAASSAPRDSEDRLPSMPGPAFGDTQSGMALAGGICAALLAREKTHKGIVVDTSLLAAGLWAMQPTIAGESLVILARCRSNITLTRPIRLIPCIGHRMIASSCSACFRPIATGRSSVLL